MEFAEYLIYTLLAAAFALGCIKIKSILFKNLVHRKPNT